MSVNSVQAQVQDTEQYKIRKQNETKQAEEIQSQIQQAEQNAQEIHKLDEYDKDNPVGEEIEGIYNVSHDDSGNLKIDYKQPASNTNLVSKNEESGEKSSTMSVKANEKTGEAKTAPTATQSANESESSDSSDDDEIEKLKKQRDTIKQQLNREIDENVKAALRAQLQSIEFQIALKSSGTN